MGLVRVEAILTHSQTTDNKGLGTMPTYVYECQQCEETFEVEQRIIEDPLKDCQCGAKGSLKRLIQPTAVMFKGSGFYVNDTSGSTIKADAPKVDAPAEPSGPSSANNPPEATSD